MRSCTSARCSPCDTLKRCGGTKRRCNIPVRCSKDRRCGWRHAFVVRGRNQRCQTCPVSPETSEDERSAHLHIHVHVHVHVRTHAQPSHTSSTCTRTPAPTPTNRPTSTSASPNTRPHSHIHTHVQPGTYSHIHTHAQTHNHAPHTHAFTLTSSHAHAHSRVQHTFSQAFETVQRSNYIIVLDSEQLRKSKKVSSVGLQTYHAPCTMHHENWTRSIGRTVKPRCFWRHMFRPNTQAEGGQDLCCSRIGAAPAPKCQCDLHSPGKSDANGRDRGRTRAPKACLAGELRRANRVGQVAPISKPVGPSPQENGGLFNANLLPSLT